MEHGKYKNLDLYLLHWPLARDKKEECDKINIDTWRALE